ncbi:MAG: hypothetical protein INR70_00480 [Parafilimonas terrae]|nr:hypothetical protein [Parafilimonas terrae]
MNAPYTRSFSFSGFQSNRPNLPLPGQRVDIELDNIARSFEAVWLAIQAGGGGGGSGPALDLPIAGRSLKVNLLSSPAIPQVVLFDQFKAELGVGSGGGVPPDWADIQNKPAFGTAAARDVGAAAGQVAAGDDPRIVGALQAAQNGLDIPNKGLFRDRLGLKGAALLDVGTTANTVMAGDDPRVPQQALGAAAFLGVGASGGVALYDDLRLAALPVLGTAAGMKTDGTDACPGFVAACDAALASSPRGGSLFVPKGRYVFLTRPTINIPAGKRLRLIGEGDGTTAFVFPNTGGIIFNYATYRSSLLMADIAVLCPRQGGGIGIRLVCNQLNGNPADTAQSAFYNVTVRGENGPDPNSGWAIPNGNYWTLGMSVENVSNVNWFGGIYCGAGGAVSNGAGGFTYVSQGDGVKIVGSASLQSYGCAYNFNGTTFNWIQQGIIYGEWLQGLYCSTTNFTGGAKGVVCLEDRKGSVLHGLNLNLCQFGLSNVSIDISGDIGGVGITNCLVVPLLGQVGIRLGAAGWSVADCQINGQNPYGQLPGGGFDNTIGVQVIGGGVGCISGNSFASLSNCVVLQGSATAISVGPNARGFVTGYVLNNSTGGNNKRVSEVALESNYLP